MDDARIHNSNLTMEFYSTIGANVVFFSLYSYNLNPVEYSFSKIKSIARDSSGDNENENLTEMINADIYRINESDVVGWYTHIRRKFALGMD